MAKSKSSFTIVCGTVPSNPSEEGGLMTFTLATLKEVKTAAEAFITVIPDELDYYQALIMGWTGDNPLSLSHQDDDYFLFTAHPNVANGIPEAFTTFVADHKVPEGPAVWNDKTQKWDV